MITLDVLLHAAIQHLAHGGLPLITPTKSRYSSPTSSASLRAVAQDLSLLAPLRLLIGMQNPIHHTMPTDGELVATALGGDRAAYGTLVARHQDAACAVAYSVCGDFHASEDVAQEVFVSAYRQLKDLRDTDRFRAWICGMARNASLSHVRSTGRRGGRPVADAHEHADDAASPLADTIAAEESALVWQTVDSLDESYREPLILFYREQESVASVASALELSEDVVRQRLSRGRAMLRDELAKRIEGVLVRTRPSAAFTAGVMGAITPIAIGVGLTLTTAGSASASTGLTGTSSATTGGAIAGSAFAAMFTSALVSLAGIFVFFRYMRSPHVPEAERRLTKRALAFAFGSSAIFTVWLIWFTITKGRALAEMGMNPALILTASVFVFCAFNVIVPIWAMHKAEMGSQRYWAANRSRVRRYKSRWSFLGLPLVSIAFGPNLELGEKRGVAKGWFAMGDVAIGLMSFGGVSFGIVSVGGISLGLLSLGGIALGAVALGCTTVGFISCGAMALGWQVAVGGCAVAHDLAIGGLAVASKMAFGGAAVAAVVNNSAEWTRLTTETYVGPLMRLLPHAGWLSLLGVPGLFYAFREIRHKRL